MEEECEHEDAEQAAVEEGANHVYGLNERSETASKLREADRIKTPKDSREPGCPEVVSIGRVLLYMAAVDVYDCDGGERIDLSRRRRHGGGEDHSYHQADNSHRQIARDVRQKDVVGVMEIGADQLLGLVVRLLELLLGSLIA